MPEVTQQETYRVVIDSIGTATPVAANVLAEALSTPADMVYKALYNTPTVMVSDVEAAVAEQTRALLQELGLEVSVQPSDAPELATTSTVDIAVYLPNAALLPKVCQQLSEFLGCKFAEALAMLIEEPALVVGGVSPNTAKALTERLDAEITTIDPKEGKYTLVFTGTDRVMEQQLQRYLDKHHVAADLKKNPRIENLDYDCSQLIWRRFQSTGMVKIVNQGLERFELVLDEIDVDQAGWREKLVSFTGMPDEIVDEVMDHLPIQVAAALPANDVKDQLKALAEVGLHCSFKPVYGQAYQLEITHMGDLKKVQEILGKIMPEDHLPKRANTIWRSQLPLNDLMARYTVAQLEAAGAEVEYETHAEA